jgi:hypothetical protein
MPIRGEYVRFGIENGPFKYRIFLKLNIYYTQKAPTLKRGTKD